MWMLGMDVGCEMWMYSSLQVLWILRCTPIRLSNLDVDVGCECGMWDMDVGCGCGM